MARSPVSPQPTAKRFPRSGPRLIRLLAKRFILSGRRNHQQAPFSLLSLLWFLAALSLFHGTASADCGDRAIEETEVVCCDGSRFPDVYCEPGGDPRNDCDEGLGSCCGNHSYHSANAYVSYSCCQPPAGGCEDPYIWDPVLCKCKGKGGSPIIIDTKGQGFHLTSAADGVVFDITGNGHPVRIAWTAATSGNAFLALDRSHSGTIDSGKELFGNFTEQARSPDRNGFLALAEFDKPENGGNGDGVIDKKDAVFALLLLWIDENHDGISQANEIHGLPELGVFSLSLKYRESRRTDQFGNQFRYKAAVNPDRKDGESQDGRWAYDVFFATEDTRTGGITGRFGGATIRHACSGKSDFKLPIDGLLDPDLSAPVDQPR